MPIHRFKRQVLNADFDHLARPEVGLVLLHARTALQVPSLDSRNPHGCSTLTPADRT